MKSSPYIYYNMLLVFFFALFCCSHAYAITLADVPDSILRNLNAGVPQEVIILYDDQDVEKESAQMRRNSFLDHDDDAILAFKAGRYRNLKDVVETGFTPNETETIADHSHLPMRSKRFHSRAALDKLLLRPEVKAIYENSPVYPHLAYSLPFINQPAVETAGMAGSGTTVAVIDTGINYTLAAFGSCSAPGASAGCRVAASVDVTGGGVTLNSDLKGHGTNVAGIVSGVAPGAKIAAINAFSGGTSNNTWILAGINWAIANKNTYGITAINMSLGDGGNYTVPCSSSRTNVFLAPITNARNAGILPIASSGNSALTSGMAAPACTPGVVSVGAVYDANWSGPYTWSSGCTDSTSGADKIPCFSNSASFLTLLAPGAFITAAGIQYAGTSQAAPHVAGAAAVLRAAFPGDTLPQTVTRMVSNAVSITDSRNGITFPRINLMAAIGAPGNDLFVNRSALSGDTGTLGSNNLNASGENGEPVHAGAAGGRSVWWSWTPTSSGVASVTTHGSNFDTLLAIYTGTSVNNLAAVAANNNDGSIGATSGVAFVALAGTTYQIAVDGTNGATGQISLSWSLEQQADLALVMSGPVGPIITGDSVAYDIAVTNNGPSTATAVILADILPVGAIIDTIPTGCTELSGTMNCSLGTLLSGGSTTTRVVLHFSAPGVYTSTAEASAATKDPLLTNNSAIVSLTDTAPPPLPVPGMPLSIAAVTALILTFLSAGINSEKFESGSV